jgi:hypothetical protein
MLALASPALKPKENTSNCMPKYEKAFDCRIARDTRSQLPPLLISLLLSRAEWEGKWSVVGRHDS